MQTAVIQQPAPTCYQCQTRLATQWISSRSARFSAPRCDACGQETVDYFASIGADVRVELIGSARMVERPEIDGIDLVQLGREILHGVVGDYDLGAVHRSRVELVKAMRDQVERRTGIECSDRQMAEIDYAASLARTTEREASDAALRTAQTALHQPLMRGIA